LTRLDRLALDGRSRSVGIEARKGKRMNKQELIGVVAESTGLTRSDTSRVVETMLDTISGVLKKGGEVRLVGFGSFAVSTRKASTGRNPRTGEPMSIKATAQPKFRPGKVLKDSVNG